MFKNLILSVLLMGALVFCIRPAFAATYLDQIGVVPETHWIPTSSNVIYSLDDSVGKGPTGYGNYVGPGYGGQAFDAEAIYASVANSRLYFGVVTGTKNGWVEGFLPGDLAIDIGNKGTYEYGVETTGLTHGYGEPSGYHAPSLLAGNIYKVTSWGQGLNNWLDGLGNQGYVSAPTEILGIDTKTYTSQAIDDFGYYDLGIIGGEQHYLIQGSIPISDFSGWNGEFTLHWTQTCGNDFVKVSATPEPASFSLLGLGLLGLFGFKRKK